MTKQESKIAIKNQTDRVNCLIADFDDDPCLATAQPLSAARTVLKDLNNDYFHQYGKFEAFDKMVKVAIGGGLI